MLFVVLLIGQRPLRACRFRSAVATQASAGSLLGDLLLSGDAEACFTASARGRQSFRRIAALRSHLDFVAHPDRLPTLPGARAVGAFFSLEGSSGAPFEGRGISLAVSNCRLSLGGEGMSMIESSAFIVKFPLARSGDARASPFRTKLLDALLRPFHMSSYVPTSIPKRNARL